MHVLEAAIRMYRNDWGELPPSRPRMVDGELMEGRHLLVQTLRGDRDDDGKVGPGARKIPRGPSYGPYVGEDQPTQRMDGEAFPSFVDAYGRPFYYYRWDGNTPGYRGSDNLGALDVGSYAKDPATGSYYRRDYLLLSQGRNGRWDLPGSDGSSDDVVNFDR